MMCHYCGSGNHHQCAGNCECTDCMAFRWNSFTDEELRTVKCALNDAGSDYSWTLRCSMLEQIKLELEGRELVKHLESCGIRYLGEVVG